MGRQRHSYLPGDLRAPDITYQNELEYLYGLLPGVILFRIALDKSDLYKMIDYFSFLYDGLSNEKKCRFAKLIRTEVGKV